jgi:hypothetical protein
VVSEDAASAAPRREETDMSDSLPDKPSQAEGDVGDDEVTEGQESGTLDAHDDSAEGSLDDDA